MKIQIQNSFTGTVLFEAEVPSDIAELSASNDRALEDLREQAASQC